MSGTACSSQRLDEERRWYRYHNLFRTFLAHKLAQTCSSAEIAALHRRAAAWYRQEGNAAEAIRHALAAQDIALAADVVEANLYTILNREEWPLLERWLKLFTGETIQGRPLLLVAQAWVLFFQRKLQAIPPLLAQAEALLAEGAAAASAPASVHCDLETLHALLFLAAGDYHRAVDCTQRALCYMEPGRDFGRGIAVFVQGMASYALQGEEQAVAFCVKISDDPLEDVVVRARALESLCHIFGIACRPIEQERAARALLKLAQEHRLDVSAAWAHRHLGSSYYERNDLAAAIRYFSLVVEQRYLAHFSCARDCFIGLALAYQAQGRGDEAEAVAAALQAFNVDRGLANLPEVDSFQARLAYLRGDTGRALQALERVQPALTVPAMNAYETATISRAMIHVMAGTAAQRRAAVASPRRPAASGGGQPLDLVSDSHSGAAGHRTSSGGQARAGPRTHGAGCQAGRAGPGHRGASSNWGRPSNVCSGIWPSARLSRPMSATCWPHFRPTRRTVARPCHLPAPAWWNRSPAGRWKSSCCSINGCRTKRSPPASSSRR